MLNSRSCEQQDEWVVEGVSTEPFYELGHSTVNTTLKSHHGMPASGNVEL